MTEMIELQEPLTCSAEHFKHTKKIRDVVLHELHVPGR